MEVINGAASTWMRAAMAIITSTSTGKDVSDFKHQCCSKGDFLFRKSFLEGIYPSN
jgi:hypothetical protein